ncbi:MAG: hypothetical protein R2734_16805 [Nocardioides sp.]
MTRYFVVDGEPADVADWFSRHPPAGYVADGGPGSVGSISDVDGFFLNLVYFDERDPDPFAQAGAALQVATLRMPDGRAGVVVAVDGAWSPARSAASYVAGEPGPLTVRLAVHRWQGDRTTRRTVAVDPERVAAALDVYDRLPGWAPAFHSCPARDAERTYTVTLHDADGTLRLALGGNCFDTATVWRNGRRLDPALANAHLLVSALGLPPAT